MSGGRRRFDAALAEDDAPADDGFKPWTQPGDAGSSFATSGSDTAGEASWGTANDPNATLGDRALEAGKDAAYSAAHGAFTGLGMNPSEWSPQIAASQQMAQERSPWSSAAGGFGGELAVQAAAGVGPVVGGALSGMGNTEGGLEEKAVGAATGGAFGKLGGMITGKLSALLSHGADDATREAVRRQLQQSGATSEDLKRLDKLGGRDHFADGARKLGLTGKPKRVEGRAERAITDIEAQRAGIVGDNPPPIDAAALGASVRGAASRYPGVTAVENAAERAALDAERLGRRGAASWDDVNAQRAYWGDKTNFAGGTPEANLRKGVYGAFNDEMGDALTLRQPGAGDAWRQLGRDEQVAIELGDIASAARDRMRNREFSLQDAGARMVTDAFGGPGPSRLSALLQRGGSQLLGNLPMGPIAGMGASSVTETVLGALQNDPQQLGPYASKFAEAAGSPEPGAVSALITRLIQTDPEFRTRILPQLRAAAGEDT